MDSAFYTTAEWRTLRDLARQRDGNRCSLSRLFGGDCSRVLHVHHLDPDGDPLELDNLLTVCHRHHPMLEAMRRYVTGTREWKRCRRHRHPYPQGRLECERRLNRVA